MGNNHMIRKITTCLLTAVLVAGSIIGCSSNTASSGGASTGGSKILFMMTDVDDNYRATLTDAIMAAGKSLGVTIDYVETGGNAETEANLITSAKASGYTAIILRPGDASTALQMNVASNDLPIIYVNNQPSDSHLEGGKYIFVGSDEYQAGQYQAE